MLRNLVLSFACHFAVLTFDLFFLTSKFHSPFFCAAAALLSFAGYGRRLGFACCRFPIRHFPQVLPSQRFPFLHVTPACEFPWPYPRRSP